MANVERAIRPNPQVCAVLFLYYNSSINLKVGLDAQI